MGFFSSAIGGVTGGGSNSTELAEIKKQLGDIEEFLLELQVDVEDLEETTLKARVVEWITTLFNVG